MPSEVAQRRQSAESASSTPLGTARWITPAEALGRFSFDDQLFSLNDAGLWVGKSNGQVWIGETADQRSSALGYRDDRHVCLVSAIRGGKGTSAIIPNLCLWPGSCIVIDPKGENAAITAARRAAGSAYAYGMGQTVRILDPFDEIQVDPSLKARYNPLDAIDPASDLAIDDAGRVASALVVVENRNDPFWEEAAREFIKGLILHVLTDADFVGRRNLVSVWRLVNQGDWISVDALRAAGEEKIPSGFDLLWPALKRNEAFSGLIAGVGDQMLSMADKTRSSVIGTARTNLEFISGPPMQRLLEASDFDLAALKTDPNGLTLYLTLPQRYMTTHFRWLRLMISLAVGEMERIKGRPATGHPTLFLLDEFAGLKRLEVIENATAQAAGFGVKFFFVVQSLVQLKEVYKDSWEVFLGSSGLQLFFQIADDFTRSYLSRQIGEQEVRRESRSGSQAQSTSDSVTDGDSTSTSRGTSSSTTDGRNYGTSASTSKGRSASVSHNYAGLIRFFSKSHSYQDGSNRSSSRSTNTGWSHSVSSSQSNTESISKSHSLSRSQSASTTDGWSEAVHKRPLLNPDEIGRLLARVDDRDHPAYPGVILALIQGEHPLLARRVNYFESPRFAGYFDPHPDFPAPPTLAEFEGRAAAEQARIRLEQERLRQTPFLWRKYAEFQNTRILRSWRRINERWSIEDQTERVDSEYFWLGFPYYRLRVRMAAVDSLLFVMRHFTSGDTCRHLEERQSRQHAEQLRHIDGYRALQSKYQDISSQLGTYDVKLARKIAAAARRAGNSNVIFPARPWWSRLYLVLKFGAGILIWIGIFIALLGYLVTL